MKRLLSAGLLVLLLVGCSEDVDTTDTSIPLKERVTAVIHDVAGEKAGEEDKADTAKTIKEDNGNVTLEINSNAHEGSKDKLLNDSSEIFAELSKMKDVKAASITWLAPLTDQYGNKKMGEILSVGLDEETFKKVNWDNYESVDLENLASEYKKHPALND